MKEKFKYGLYVFIRMVDKVKLTLSIDKKVLINYKEYCERKGIIISKQVENLMISQLKDKK